MSLHRLLNHRSAAGFVVLTLGLFCTLAQASQELLALNLEQLLNVKVQGATKVEMSYLSVPASTNVFDRNTLDLMGVRSLDELIPFVPGFSIARGDDDRYPSLTARGRRVGSSGREVLVLIDGMRIDNWFTGGAFMSAPNLSLGGMQKVEFIRGAVSQVYGSNAFTGVINMVTDPNLRDISMVLGENDAYHLQTNLGGEHDQLSHKLFVNLESEGGQSKTVAPYLQSEPVALNDGYQSGELNYQAHSGNWSFLSQFNHSEQSQFYTVGNLQPAFNGIKHDYATAAIQHRADLSNTLNITSQVGYSYYDWEVKAESLPAGALQNFSSPTSSAPLRFHVKENLSEELWFSLDAHWQASDQSGYLLGFEWRDRQKAPLLAHSNYDLAALANGDLPITYYANYNTPTESQPEASEELVALLLQNIRQFGDKNELTLGLRFDDYELAGQRMSPRIAWVHAIAERQSIKLLYSEAFRAPVSNEYFLKNNPVLLGNPELKPEVVKSSEIIWVSDLSTFRAQLGYFYSRYIDPITQPSAPVRRFENKESYHSAGIEGQVVKEFSPHWVGRINFSHLTEKPDDQFRQPDDLVTLVLSYQRGRWNWFYDI